MNNRIDVLDERNKWLEARVIGISEDKIQVHYRGYVAKYDEWIDKNHPRIAQIGSHSKAYGSGNELNKKKEFLKQLMIKEA